MHGFNGIYIMMDDSNQWCLIESSFNLFHTVDTIVLISDWLIDWLIEWNNHLEWRYIMSWFGLTHSLPTFNVFTTSMQTIVTIFKQCWTGSIFNCHPVITMYLKPIYTDQSIDNFGYLIRVRILWFLLYQLDPLPSSF